MNDKNNERILKCILWKEILAIPTYTILYNNCIKLFWIVIILGRCITLILVSKNIDINNLIEICFENYENDDKLQNIVKLGIFAVITTPILYILTFINNIDLFLIMIAIEISDFIVLKLLDNEKIKNKKVKNK